MRHRVAQATLLECSGELSRKGEKRLAQLVARYPAALLEYEQTRAEMGLLESLPNIRMPGDQARQIADSIKQRIHQKLDKQEQEEWLRTRARVIYRAMAALSALAACMVLGFGGYLIHLHMQTERQMAVARAEQTLRDYAAADSSTFTDYLYDRVARQIDGAAQSQQHIVSTDSDTDNMHQLLNDLDRTPYPVLQAHADGAL
jgi:hypothetical protein